MSKAVHKFVAGTLGVLMMPAVSFAAVDHNSAMSCYAYVHSQCYGNGKNNCSDDDYNWGLDQCDQYYPSAKIKRPVRPDGLMDRASNRKIKARIQSTFNR